MKFDAKNTISKVLVILVVTLGVLIAISIYSLKSYKEFTGAVASLSDQSVEVGLTEKIMANVSQLESYGRAYYLTLNPEELDKYLKEASTIQYEIDSLYINSAGSNYRGEVDTLRSLFRMKIRSFQELASLKLKSYNDKPSREALLALARTDSAIIADSDSMLIPKQEITTKTITSSAADNKKKEKEKKGWFSWLTSDKDEDKSIADSVQNHIVEERSVKYDSAYFDKVDTLISTVKTAIAEAEQRRQRQNAMLTGREMELLRNDQRLIEKLRTIILKINNKERDNEVTEKARALSVARSSFRSVIGFALCGGVLAVILIYFVINDILKQGKLRVNLAEAKSEAERLALVKEEFLANMSHEIRTPLNSIIGFTEQLSGTEMTAEQKEKLNNVRRSSDHLLILVNDILDFSKIESGKLRLENIGFKVEDIISESLDALSHQARNKGIELRSHINPEIKSIVVKGDPVRLKQILINLAGNGVKFTKNGYVKISAFLDPVEGDTYRVRFEIEDTGKGIDREKQKNIFEDFSQEDSSISRKYGGTGLGLAISKRLVELQKGKIFVESEPGEGATFTFFINYAAAEKEEYNDRFNPEKIDIDLKDKTLLLIDDDSMNHTLLKPTFERWKLDFDSAYDGKEGVSMAREKDYDFILVDLQMPGMSGWEVLDQIREEGGRNSNSKIVMCTANALVQQAPENKIKKLDATLLKPFKEFEIATLLGSLSSDIVIDQEWIEDDNNENMENEYTLSNFLTFANQDEVMLIQFLESFIENNRESLKNLEDHFKEGNYKEVGDTAHKMKNTFGQLEAQAVMKHLFELEKLVDENQPRKLISEHIEKTYRLSEEIFEALEKDIARMKTGVNN